MILKVRAVVQLLVITDFNGAAAIHGSSDLYHLCKHFICRYNCKDHAEKPSSLPQDYWFRKLFIVLQEPSFCFDINKRTESDPTYVELKL